MPASTSIGLLKPRLSLFQIVHIYFFAYANSEADNYYNLGLNCTYTFKLGIAIFEFRLNKYINGGIAAIRRGW